MEWRCYLQRVQDAWRYNTLLARSPQWREVEREHLKRQPKCQWCDKILGLQVHHIVPFHIAPELELEPSNLITLCEAKPQCCHLMRGHMGCWKRINPEIVQQCLLHHEK
jgi:5-methylcytosine-specific restriction enzyme A